MYRISSVMVLTLTWALMVWPLVSFAGEVVSGQDGSTVWRAGIDGLEIEWGPDRKVKRISSQATHPVRFPDRQGIAKAQTIAEEKAKAAIVRFRGEEVATGTVVSEVDNDIEEATRNQSSRETENITKTNKRVMMETLGQVTASAAAGRLRGVIVLERGYDEKREEAWVKVGISDKTIQGSEDLGSVLSGETKPNQDKKPEESPGKDGDAGISRPGSSVEKLPQKDW